VVSSLGVIGCCRPYRGAAHPTRYERIDPQALEFLEPEDPDRLSALKRLLNSLT
jgi:hypothetical protein